MTNKPRYKVCRVGYDRTKLEVTTHSKYAAHISSYGSHFLTAGLRCTAHIRSGKMGTSDTVRGSQLFQKLLAMAHKERNIIN